ncbi:GNAT family N-acetyltransferase [Sneathiella glossodoripedis]|uniref:GNAT family N-acetyltransferase n=1 Tax=Sneathiella glossodoripedis TaxID=418853 RepID=UPI00047152FD|nr:GNAT family N-acetyltransferase [Sneathiella glossodoripedis]
MSERGLEFRDLGAMDAHNLLNLSNLVGWDYTLQYWQLLIATSTVIGAFSDEGRLIACASHICFPPTHSFVGAVIVVPECQGKGIGRMVMKHLHEKIAQKKLPARLISTPEGAPLYQKLGYETVDQCHKLMRVRREVPSQLGELDGYVCKPVNADAMPLLIELDRQQFGANRSHLLSAMQQGGFAGVYLINRNTEVIEAYACRYIRDGYSVIGPVVAITQKQALTLCQMLAYGQSSKLRIDTYSNQSSFREQLFQMGFEEVDRSPVMALNEVFPYEEKPGIFALVSHAFG